MKRLALPLLLILSTSAFADEGKWTPQQVLQLDARALAAAGLEIPTSRLWDDKRGTGLLAAAINTSGCSAGWISADGLFITNHHCVFPVLQEHATPENDVITNGFLARSRGEELTSKTARVTIPHRFIDVTAEIQAAVRKNATDAERFRAIQRKETELVARCEQQPGMRCRVAHHDGGVQSVLQEMKELSDVRLVYAPPRAVGEYGGEIDNWMWPRHTGDFAVARAYVDGKPYRPEFFFPIATRALEPGDFVMVLGYPGTTYRALTADEMEERRQWFALRAGLYGDWIRILEDATKGRDEGEIAVAATVKTLANRQKNAEGQLAGFKRGRIVEKQRANDDAVLASQPQARAAYGGLAKLAAEKKEALARDFLLEQVRATPAGLPPGPKSLVFAVAIAESAFERQKRDAERSPTFQERNLGRLRERLEREQKSFDARADRALTADFLKRAKLANAPSLDAIFSSKLLDPAERTKMFGETVEQLRARRDPLVDFAQSLMPIIRDMAERRDRWEGTVYRLRPEWRRAVIAHAGRPVAPDANGTLRVSFAHVKGYAPQDGLWAVPFTTLAGVVAKHTGAEPFNVPAPILEAAEAAEAAKVPVAFLADADTTGGNSGSPVVNGRGELVGVNFDRVWENVANDFGYNPDVARNISVDVRYLLWMLRVQRAGELLSELGVK